MANLKGGVVGWWQKFWRERAKKKLLLRLQTAKNVTAIEIVSEVLDRYDIRFLTTEYSRSNGKAVNVQFHYNPIDLLKRVTEFRVALEQGEYLVIAPTKPTQSNFEDWYGHYGSSINTRHWLPSLCKEVATLAKAMRGAEICAIDNYSYYVRKSGAISSDLTMLAVALLALGE